MTGIVDKMTPRVAAAAGVSQTVARAVMATYWLTARRAMAKARDGGGDKAIWLHGLGRLWGVNGGTRRYDNKRSYVENKEDQAEVRHDSDDGEQV